MSYCEDCVRMDKVRILPCSALLHYIGIGYENERLYCGAYVDRMVFGGRRLHEICENGDYIQCEYH